MATTSNNNSNSKSGKGKESSVSSKDSAGSKEKQQQATTNNNNNDYNKSKENKENNNEIGVDKYKKFEDEGVVFKAKLIGSELVMEPRGDKMCQNSIQRLKAIIKGTNSHKRRIVLKISYDGVKVYDEKTNEILHHHEVSQISYIASDDTDNRTFGYVSDVPSKAHQFICFKTGGPAINVMSVISALFEAVLERKNQLEKEKKQVVVGAGGDKSQSQDNDAEQQQTNIVQAAQDSIDLIGDSGIMDGDASMNSEFSSSGIVSKQPFMSGIEGRQAQSSGSMLNDNNIASSADSFSHQLSGANMVGMGAKSNKQSASSDLIFDDLFAGLSDPIIVDKNDSLISYKPSNATQLAGSFNQPPVPLGDNHHHHHHHHHHHQQQQPTMMHSGHNQQQQPPQHRPQMARAAVLPIPKRQSQHHQAPLLPPPSSLPRPAPMLPSGPSRNRSLVYNHSSVSLSDAAFHSSFNSQQSQNDSYVDRYAVFNDIDSLPSIFESACLGSANNDNSNSNNNNNNNTQSTGAISAATARAHAIHSSSAAAASFMEPLRPSASMMGSSSSTNTMFRQTNPFDDDFFN